MSILTDTYTTNEIAAAYRKARLRYVGITLTRAIENPLIYRALCLQAQAARDKEQQHGKPAPQLQAA